jgi:hypothetical protein
LIAEHLLNIHDKRPDVGEIIVTLFEYCDLNCLFCNQDHDSYEGINSIVNKFEEIKLSIDQLISKGKKTFSIHMMGGELFSDKIEDSVFDDYRILTEKTLQYGKEKNIPIEVSFVTNFVWTKKDRVRSFLDTNNLKVMTSYDPAGRFNANTFEIYKTNVVEFKDYIQTVNVIMTKPNIDKFVKNQVPFFDFIYDNFAIYFDYYGPGKNHEFLLAKDVELRDFMKYMFDTWPKCYPFKTFDVKTKNKMSCMDTLTVMPNGEWGGCGHFEKLVKIIPIKSITEEQWFESYNCFECEHFQRCSMGCFMSNHVKDMRTQKTCWLKEVYDYVDLEDRKKNDCSINRT